MTGATFQNEPEQEARREDPTPPLRHPTPMSGIHREDWEALERAEERAWATIRDAATKIAAAAGFVWRSGDGAGGGVMRVVADACAAEGLVGKDRVPKPLGRHALLAQRDGWWCAYCSHPLGWGNPTAVRSPEVEHRIPKSRGGTDSIDNLCLSCGPCNSEKGSMTDVEYLAWKADRQVAAT